MRAIHIFLGTLLISVLVHSVYWKYLDDSVDQQSWIREMERYSTTPLEQHRTSFYYGYPATTVLAPAKLVSSVGVSFADAFVGIMTLGISLPVAACVVLSYILRPNRLWFLGVGGVMIFSQLYYVSTPPSAIVAPFCTLMMLYGLYIYEQNKTNIGASVALGSIAGVAMATRLDISLAVLTFIGICVLPVIKKQIITVIIAAVFMYILCNPYMWQFPIGHMVDIIHKITYHTSLASASVFPYWKIFLTIPLSLMGLCASLLFLVPRAYFSPLPRRFIATVVVLCVSVTCGLVLFSSYYPAWYFYPVLQVFELLLVLFVLDALVYIDRKNLQWPILTTLFLGNLTVFFTKLFL